ncbi:MAG: mechanosensitive ion channel domain-containing protein [Sphingomicrobium sp.]
MRDKILSWTGVWAWFDANSDGLLIGILVAAALVAGMLVLRHLGERILAACPHCTNWRGVIGNVLARTTFLFMVAAAVAIVTAYAPVPARFGRAVNILFIVAASLQAAVWARELIIGVVRSRVGEDPGESTLGNAMALIRVMVSVAAFALAFIVILDNLGVNVTTLIAGLGIGGIAIGLAAQGIFSDLFAALAIVFDKPFRRGDTIQYDQTTGTVERIGLKTTRLRSLNGEQVVMANTKLLEREIHNYAVGETRRSLLPFGLIYQTAPDQLQKVMPLAKAAVESRHGCHFVRCAILGFGDSSIDFELIYDSHKVEPNEVAADRTAVAIALLTTFAKHGLEFAYPTQTTFTSAPDGTMIMPYPQVQQVVSVKKAGEDS